ncbi:MAG: GNAT family N-acetyltransferase [Crocinitomicaceae bacterium]|nr:GNAT family N-acetyltransferase [Crocinitomicaceae bacterium]
MIEVRAPQTDQEWEAYFDLRYQELRKPWNQPKGSEKADDEDAAFHFAAFEDGQLLGVSRLQRNSLEQGQVRFMAVSDQAQGKGIGKKIMAEVEAFAKKIGMTEIVLQAREIAVPFYLAIGYENVEKTHLLFGEIQHYLMRKKI